MTTNLIGAEVSNASILADPLHIPAGSSLEASVGNSPLVRLRRVTKNISKGVDVYAKTEWTNPGGSVKDRPALYIIREAEQRGLLTPGRRILDATSGNMGIAYATFAAARGYEVTLCLPENASPERMKLLEALGAELVLTDPLEGSDGAILKARELAATRPDLYFYADQYSNPANWQAHYATTGPEIYAQTDARITHFVAGLGTSGTLMGAGRYLREQKPAIELVGLQPDGPFHGLEGLKHMESALRPGIYDERVPDRQVTVQTEDAFEMTRCLAREEGLLVGISAGAAAVAALQLASELDEGVVVTIFPDAAYKYLSENFWNNGPTRCENPITP
ncbi:MAG: PLP-dependent cysteine synthase family protein [Anaerolineales bacterium]